MELAISTTAEQNGLVVVWEGSFLSYWQPCLQPKTTWLQNYRVQLVTCLTRWFWNQLTFDTEQRCSQDA